MAGETNDIFDVKRIRRLVELMREFDLREVDLKNGEQEIRLARGAEYAAVPAPLPAASPTPHVGVSVSPLPSSGGSPAVSAPTAASLVEIKSPMVGTYYSGPNPQSPPFVKVGDHVGRESVVCIIEAMKVFNEIPADATGKVVSILVENGDSVEFGQPLFRIDPNG